jgi:hypothetical protein
MPSPPITVGELTDVPTYDSPIASPWAQEVTRMVVHRFPNVAARDAFGAWPSGRRAFTTDTETLWLRHNGGWVILSEQPQPWAVLVNDAGVQSPWSSAGSVYARTSGWCQLDAVLTCTGPAPFPGAGFLAFTLPFPAATPMADGRFVVSHFDANAGGWYLGGVWPSAANQLGIAYFRPAGGTNNPMVSTGIKPDAPFVWVAGSTIRISGPYRMASRYT